MIHEDRLKYKLAIGSLLHDIGKVCYRVKANTNHSTSGYDLVKDFIDDEDVLNCIKYHHKSLIDKAENLDDNCISYITYIADNIASFSDRRKDEESEDTGYVRHTSLDNIFNQTRNSIAKTSYALKGTVSKKNIPTAEEIAYDESKYEFILNKFTENLSQHSIEDKDYLNILDRVSKDTLSYVPSSTNVSEVKDISLYNHVRLTTAFALCIYDYMKEQRYKTYKSALYNKSTFYEKDAYILYRGKLSGLNTLKANAKKMGITELVKRYEYLDSLLDYVVYQLNEQALSLSPCNVLFKTDEEFMLLLPNTVKVKQTVESFEQQLRNYFIDNFAVDLCYISASRVCSSNTFKNVDNEFENILLDMVAETSGNTTGYDLTDILRLNNDIALKPKYVCHSCMSVSNGYMENEHYYCNVCKNVKKTGNVVKGYKAVSEGYNGQGICMPFADTLSFKDSTDGSEMYSTVFDIDISDVAYMSGDSGVLNVEVDNLQQFLINSLDSNILTITRYTEIIEKISIFFEVYAKQIAEQGIAFTNRVGKKRDIVLLSTSVNGLIAKGNWKELLGFLIDLSDDFNRFTNNSVTFSASIVNSKLSHGIAMRKSKEMLLTCKNNGGNRIAFLRDKCVFPVEKFKQAIMGEFLSFFNDYFDDFISNSLLEEFETIITGVSLGKGYSLPKLLYIIARNKPNKEEKDLLIQYNNLKLYIKKYLDKSDIMSDRSFETAYKIYCMARTGREFKF